MYSRLDNAFSGRSNGRSALVFGFWTICIGFWILDDLHWFLDFGFYTKRVAGVQKLSEVGDMLVTVIRSVRRAETFSVRKKMAAIKFEKKFRRPGRVLVTQLNPPLHSERG
jgi:hypothetical protein